MQIKFCIRKIEIHKNSAENNRKRLITKKGVKSIMNRQRHHYLVFLESYVEL